MDKLNNITNTKAAITTAEPVKTEKDKKQKVSLKERKFSSKEVCSIAAATAITAAFLGGQILSGRARARFRFANAEKNRLAEGVKALREQIRGVTEDNVLLNNTNKDLRKEISTLSAKLKDIIEGDLSPKDIRENIYQTLRVKIFGENLDYDIANPPVVGRGNFKVFEDAVDLPAVQKTSNRADAISLDIPQIGVDGRFEFSMPKTSEVKVTHMPTKDFSPVYNSQTGVTESYADSVRWNADKIARDILQNFYDGHGQTLDGVRFSFVPNGRKVKVRISGDSTYTVDKAIYIGESTKRDDAKAAGNFGEGLKMCALKLLKDYDIGNMKVASDNWELTFSLQNTALTDKRVLSYTLEKADKYNGNYVEFETDNMELLQSLRNTINRFYHRSNEHFRCPDFENDVLGVKILPTDEVGGIYIAGQRFEFENSYDGLKGVSIFFKEKPDPTYMDVSRDRTSLQDYNFNFLGLHYGRENAMPLDEQVKLLSSLQKYWSKSKPPGAMDYFVEGMVSRMKDRVHIKFPDKYVAYSPASPDIVLELQLAGYTICKEDFTKLGMKSIKDLYGDARAHEPLVPNDVQAKKIMILKEAIKNLSPALEDKHFTPEELDTKIYLFDRTSTKENKIFEDTCAEAIIDNGTSKGFWLDKTFLDNSSLSELLETALHELSHKVGGDESAEFSYKLTNVNRDTITHILNDVVAKENIQALSRIWDEL